MQDLFDLQGYWTGNFDGTNSGGLSFDITQREAVISGAATMFEPAIGPPYAYEIVGQAGSPHRLLLKSLGPLHPLPDSLQLILGDLQVEAFCNSSDSLTGKWKSSIGTNGTFAARRFKSDTNQEVDKATALKNVFLCYSHRDADFLQRLIVHMKPLEKQGSLNLWVDTKLRAGDNWKEEIFRALDKATVAVLLVSADFLASDFINDHELPTLLQTAATKGTRILPLIVRPCGFYRTPILKDFQTVNGDRVPASELSPSKREQLYEDLMQQLES